MKQEIVLSNAQTESPKPAKETTRRGKKKYSKPSLVYQAPLEAMAATCTTSPGKSSGVCSALFS